MYTYSQLTHDSEMAASQTNTNLLLVLCPNIHTTIYVWITVPLLMCRRFPRCDVRLGVLQEAEAGI